MPKKIFVDTGFFINLLLRGEKYHGKSRAIWQREIKAGTKIFSSNYILDETLTRLIYDQSFSSAKKFKNITEAAVQQGKMAIIWIDEPLTQKAWTIFEKFKEHKLSFTDAATAAVVTQFKIDEILTFDSDFKKICLKVQP